MTSDTPPKTIGRYEIRTELGRGGMATVYRAFDPQVHREVAVKLLPRQFTHDTSFRGRFAREAKIVAALDHPAIVPVLDYGEEGDQPYLVMRLMSGGTLADRLELGPIPLSEIGRILNRVAPALDAAHKRGAIHRDLKPSNILFDQWNEPYIADFGIVKLSESTVSTLSQYAMGTPAYMSPEQIEGKAELDGRSDVYALGVILFEMLTGGRPYEATTPMGLMMQHVSEPIPEVGARLADLPANTQAIINQAMAKRRDDRYPTATALATDVAYLAGLPAPTPPPLTPQTPLPVPRPATAPRPQPSSSQAASPPPASIHPVDPTQVMAPEKSRPVSQANQPAAAPRKLPLWVLGLGGVGLLIGVVVIIAVAALLLNNQDAENGGNAAANNTTNNETASTNNDDTSSGNEDGTENSDDSTIDEPTLEPTPEIPVAAFPNWTLDDVAAPFPLANSGFPLPTDRLPIVPENVAGITPVAQYSRGIITDIEYSPDGQWLVAAAVEGIYLYQASDLSFVWYKEAQDNNVAFHPDSQTLAVAAEGDVQLWDVATGELQLTLIDNDSYTGYLLTYSPDGQYLVGAYDDDNIQFWSSDGLFLQELVGNGERLNDLTFSPDSTHLAATSQDTVTIWDVEAGSVSETLTQTEAPFGEVRYLNETTLVAAAPQSGIFFWENVDGAFQLTQTITETIPTTGFFAANADGLMATGIWYTTFLWRAGETQPFYILPSTGGSTVNLAFSPDGTTLVTGSENFLARWRVDGETPEPLDFLIPHAGELIDVGFSPDGAMIAATSINEVGLVWESSSGELRQMLLNPSQAPSALMYTPDGDLVMGSFSGNTQLWLGESGQLRFTTENEAEFHYVWDVAVSADNAWIAAALSGGHVAVLDRQTGEVVQILDAHAPDTDVNAVTFFPRTDITLLATAGDDGLVNVWQFDGEEFVLLISYDDAPTSVNALASDGVYLAAGDDAGTVWFYYLETTDNAAAASAGELSVNAGVAALAYAPDGQLLAVDTFNGEIEIVYPAEGTTLQVLPWGGTVAFSPDGTLLAAASRAGLLLWAIIP